MLIRRIAIDLELKQRSFLVSFGSGCIWAFLPFIINEYLWLNLSPQLLLLHTSAAFIFGFVFAEIIPIVARLLPFILTITLLTLLVVQEFSSRQYIINQQQQFLSRTDNCAGSALYMNDQVAYCIKLPSKTINSYCRVIKGNEFQCRLVLGQDTLDSVTFQHR